MVITAPPPLPDPEKQAQEVAEQLTETLGRGRLRYSDSNTLRYSLIAVVEFAIEELNNLLLWANRVGTRVACIPDDRGDLLPIVGVPLSPALAEEFPEVVSQEFFKESRFGDALFRQVFGGNEIVWWEPTKVPQEVLWPLAKFLRVRFQWVKDNPQFLSLGAAASSQANSPYLPFTVHTQTSGLRIHYSNTFAINFNNVFGAPTTPLKGWILPGIHKFAGMDNSGNFHYDKGTFTTPPDYSARLVI